MQKLVKTVIALSNIIPEPNRIWKPHADLICIYNKLVWQWNVCCTNHIFLHSRTFITQTSFSITQLKTELITWFELFLLSFFPFYKVTGKFILDSNCLYTSPTVFHSLFLTHCILSISLNDVNNLHYGNTI